MGILITDQWKLDGDCGKCRRGNYCAKDCSAHKRRIEKIKEQAFKNVLAEKYPDFAKVIDSIQKEEI